MNNFFYKESDFSLFKKALKVVKDEPVVVNILSSDSSLKSDKPDESVEKRPTPKIYNQKYEPNSYDRMFGPRKRIYTSVDLNNFSGWKNKNYRKTEQNIESDSNKTKFSLSDYMSQRLGANKYNGLDTAKNDKQKSIDKIGINDPQYRKYYLDSFMTKLEEETRVKEKYDEDMLAPLDDKLQNVVPDSSQDEDFGFNDNLIKEFADDETTRGDTYRINSNELEKIKQNIANKNKPKEQKRTIEKYEYDEQKDDFDLSKFDFDDEDNDSSEKNIEEEVKVEEEVKPEPKPEPKPSSVLARRFEKMRKQREEEIGRETMLSEEERQKRLSEAEVQVRELIERTQNIKKPEQYAEIERGKKEICYKTKVSRQDVDEIYDRLIKQYQVIVISEKDDGKKNKEKLNNELKINLQKSEIEMNKKLLEVASKMGKDQSIKRRTNTKKVVIEQKTRAEGPEVKVVNKTEEVEKTPKVNIVIGDNVSKEDLNNIDIKIPVKSKGRKKKYNPKRRIDSDIIGSIDF